MSRRFQFSLRALLVVAAILAIAAVSPFVGAWLFDFATFAQGGMPEAELKAIGIGQIVTPIASTITAIVVVVMIKKGIHKKLSLPAPALVCIACAVLGLFLWQAAVLTYQFVSPGFGK
ncbi:MAG TPA: hypothetical protein VG826_06240 [Pirellulales bacterium]|nr:hypothetical protein [Pirellulales bacterium]